MEILSILQNIWRNLFTEIYTIAIIRYCGKTVAMHHQRSLEREQFWWFLHFMDVYLIR
jgi:hypothetical protein